MNTRFKLAVAALALTTCTAHAQTMDAQMVGPGGPIQRPVVIQPVPIQAIQQVDPTAIQRKQAQLDADYEHAQQMIQRATDRSMCRFYNSYC